MRGVIVIPARLEANRLPRKLLLAETGMPLICHTVLAAARVRDASGGLFREVVVAADAEEICAAVERLDRERGIGARAMMTRRDHASGSDRIAEAAAGLSPEIDAVLNLQGDEPEIDAGEVLALARLFAASDADIATLVYPVTDLRDRENPALVKAALGAGGRALYFSRADIPFRRDGGSTDQSSYGHVGIYLYRRSSLERFVALPPGKLELTEKLEQLRALENGMTIIARIADSRPPKGIDTREDYDAFLARNR
ncbi:MAG: 3-deoxy-manno-octulosonate cytidylyltransferase [Planctomycetota bacterium]|jgi:3-deoxy-manno-octulosonate cytidylyltransferase (CMP-KDO synthetase)|nr:3-deoxy-manno-octulosonate cytidylyltransferase [Planctomycetota bacterium]